MVGALQVFISRKVAEAKVALLTIENSKKKKEENCPPFFSLNNLLPFLAAYDVAEIILSSLCNEAGGFLGPKV